MKPLVLAMMISLGGVAEGLAQRDDLGRSAAAARGRECLVRHEDHLRRHRRAMQAEAPLRRRDQALHHRGDVVNVQARAVIGAVARLAAQHFDDSAHPALAHRVFALDHQRAGAHAEDRAVTAAVERERRFVDAVVGGGCARRQKARADPFHQVFAGHVVRADHDHAAAAPGANPVLGHADRLSRAGAGGVDMGVRAARADILGELAVTHRQDAEEEAAVKFIRLALQLIAQVSRRGG